MLPGHLRRSCQPCPLPPAVRLWARSLLMEGLSQRPGEQVAKHRPALLSCGPDCRAPPSCHPAQASRHRAASRGRTEGSNGSRPGSQLVWLQPVAQPGLSQLPDPHPSSPTKQLSQAQARHWLRSYRPFSPRYSTSFSQMSTSTTGPPKSVAKRSHVF